MDFDYSPRQREIYERVGELGRTRFAPRAEAHEAAGRTPIANLRDLFDAGLYGATLTKESGGLGSGAHGEDTLLSLLVVEQTARYCPSTAQCIHIHFNSTHRLDQVGTPDLKARIFDKVLHEGALVSATASEPGRSARGLYNLLTTAEKVDGGWIINGHKNYGTLTDVAGFHTISAVIKGASLPDGHLTVMIPDGAPGFAVIPDTWDAIGMRAAYSPELTLDNVFVPDADTLGEPGETPKNRWQARFHLSFAAQYLGACEGIFDYLVDYLPKRGTAGDTYTQLRLGEIRVSIDAARWMIYRAAWLWQAGKIDEAELFSMTAKHQALETAVIVMDKASQIAGSSAFLNRTAFSRFIRDLRFQTLHENLDRSSATLGKFHLGQSFDVTSRL